MRKPGRKAGRQRPRLEADVKGAIVGNAAILKLQKHILGVFGGWSDDDLANSMTGCGDQRSQPKENVYCRCSDVRKDGMTMGTDIRHPQRGHFGIRFSK